MAHQEIEIPPSRVALLDSKELDLEIKSILRNQLSTIISHLPLEVTYFEPELQTILKTLIWLLSIKQKSATFGQQVLKIKYSTTTSLKMLNILGFLQIGASYLKQRLPDFLFLIPKKGTSDLGFQILNKCEIIIKIVNLTYLIKFLRRGGASSFLEYILGLKPISTVTPSSRSIGYSFMTRELIWHGLIELLVLVIPMINYHALKRKFKKCIAVNTPEKKETSDQVLTKDNLKCAICKDFPILPHHMGCSHLFCYYCLLSQRLADKKFECPQCGYSNPDTSIIPLSLKW